MLSFIKREAVLCAALAAAVASAFFSPPSARYIGYIDFRVLALLFCLMLAVAGAKKTGAFALAAAALARRSGGVRRLTAALTAASFFSSMLITNDVALITLVPLALMLLEKEPKALMAAVISMTLAANLGGMLTPIGNPQNLYLYTFFEMSPGAFFASMLPPVAVSAVMIAAYDLTVRPAGVLAKASPAPVLAKASPTPAAPGEEKTAAPAPLAPEAPEAAGDVLKRLWPWAGLFLVCVACVARILDYRIMLGVTAAAVLLLDRRLFARVDYSLLATFAAFFIFVGNIQQLPRVSLLLQGAVAGHELGAGVLLSQVISNVPAAMLLSGFCSDPQALLVGVDIGGLGTPVASMASLISYKLYAASPSARRGRYMGLFLLINFIMLAILWAVCALLR